MPHSTRLRLEILEDRDVPAFGLDTSFGTSGLIMDALPDTRFNAIVGTASAPGGKLVSAGNLAGPDPFDSGDVAVRPAHLGRQAPTRSLAVETVWRTSRSTRFTWWPGSRPSRMAR